MIITVTALPRSGTAFVSMLLQLHPECMAYHELAYFDRNWRDVLMNNDADIVADCNTYALMNEYDVVPDKKVYIVNSITRSHESSEVALKRPIDIRIFSYLYSLSHAWCNTNNCFVIMREDVFTQKGCEDIWKFCFGDDNVPYEKISQLIKLNIQQHNADKVFTEYKEFIL